MIRLPSILKSFFETEDKPTADQFSDLIDSFLHKTDSIFVGDILEATDFTQDGGNYYCDIVHNKTANQCLAFLVQDSGIYDNTINTYSFSKRSSSTVRLTSSWVAEGLKVIVIKLT